MSAPQTPEERNAIIKQLADFVTSTEEKSPLDNSKLLDFFLDIAANETTTLQLSFDIFLEYLEKVPQFRTTETPKFAELLSTLLDSAKPLEDRSKAAIPLIIITPFTTPEKAAQITKGGIEVCQALINKDSELPMKFIDNFDDMMCNDMEEPNLKQVYEMFKTQLTGDNRVAALCCIAPVAEDIADALEGESEFITKQILDALKGSRLEKEAGALLIEYFTGYFEKVPEDCPKLEEILPTLIEMMNNAENKVEETKRAHRAFQALIECHIYDEDKIKDFIALFPQFTTKIAIKYYFKLLSVFINPEDEDDCCCEGGCCDHDHCHGHEPNLTVIQAVLDFAKGILTKDDVTALIKGHALDLLSILASIDSMYVEEILTLAIDVATKLINDKSYETFVYISPFFVALSKLFKDKTQAQIKPLLATLFESYNKPEIGEPKVQRNLLADICATLAEGINDAVVPQAIDAVIATLKEQDTKAFFQGCASIIAIRPKLTVEKATEAFQVVASRIDDMTDNMNISTLVHTLTKIVKKVSIDADIVAPVLNKILAGDIKALNGHKPIDQEAINEVYFKFTQAFIRKYPAKAAPVCQTLIEWMKTASIHAMSYILESLSAGLEVAAIKEDGAKEIADFLKQFLGTLQIQDTNEISAALECLTAINKSYPAAIQPADPIIQGVLAFVKQISESNEEEEEFMEESISIMPDIAKFVFNVYASTPSLEVEENLLGALVALMPFGPEVEGVGDLIQCLIDMLEDQERFECIVVPTLKCFTELLLMKKSELEEFEFEEDLIKSMKTTLKTICKKKPAVAKQISKDYQKSRAKLNRFNALIR